MLFSFCKPKKHKHKPPAIEQSNSQSSSTKPKKLPSSSSPTNSTSTNFILPSTASTASFNKNTASSSSSQSSLSSTSLRQSIRPSQSHFYSFPQISAATHNFLLKPHSSSSSSTSWRCNLHHQQVLVIQRRFRRPIQTPELIERLSLICKSHHSSLVSLKGASVSGSYIYLVYDYVAGASLAHCLRNVNNPNYTVLSSWISRIKVAHDVAHGLDYVHNSTGLGFEFVHNHIKSSSVVVSEDSLCAKICHFGTAELCGEIDRDSGKEGEKGKDYKRSDSKVNKFEGTRGYMAPEFLKNGIATQEGDVYAFGVVILELSSGMEALTYRVDEETGSYVRISVVEEARRAVESGIRQWVDRRLRDSYPVEVVEKLVRLALDCVDDDPNSRPDMGKVVARVSQMFLESQDWLEKMGSVTDFTVSLAPR